MFSPSNRKISVTAFVFLAATLFLAVWFNPFGLVLTADQRLDRAKALASAWDLVAAERMLEPVATGASMVPEVQKLYAEIVFKRGEMQRAEKILTLVLSIDSIPRLKDLTYFALVQFYLSNLDGATSSVQKLLSLSRAAADTEYIGQAFHILGRVAFNRAHYDSALIFQRKALQIARQAGLKNLEANALRQIGVLYWYRGKADSARTGFYDPALQLYSSVGDRIGEATTLSNIGLLYWEKMDWENHIRYQLKAYEIRKQIGDQIGLADTYYFLAIIPRLGKESTPYSTSCLWKSYQLAKRIGYVWGQEVALRSLMTGYSATFGLKAGRFAEDRFPLADSLKTFSGEGYLLNIEEQGHRYLKSKRFKEAEAQYRVALRIADSLGYASLKVGILLYLGEALIGKNDPREAERIFMRAKHENRGDERKRRFAESGVGLSLLQQGHFRRAKALFLDQVMEFDSLYASILRERNPDTAYDQAVGFLHDFRTAAYEGLMEALMRLRDNELFKHLELERITAFWGERHTLGTGNDRSPLQIAFKGFVDQLNRYDEGAGKAEEIQSLLTKIAEVRQAMVVQQNIHSQASQSTEFLEPVDFNTLQNILGPREVFLEYFVGDRIALVLAIRKDRTDIIELGAKKEELLTLVDLYRRAVSRGASDPNDDVWKGVSHLLFTRILQPVIDAGMIQQQDHIVVSPHSSLHLLPFHALNLNARGENPMFCVERYAFSYTPSAAVLVQKRKHSSASMNSMLAIAPAAQDLPYTELEIRQIPALLFTSVSTIKNDQATADRILQSIEHYDVVHVAAHARVNFRFPLYSSVQCADRQLELHEILRLRLRSPLVVLSACETGLGTGVINDVPHGEDLVGFPRAFLYAGASTVISSLWLVEDKATALLMLRFYANTLSLRHSQKPSKIPIFIDALTEAQRQILRENRTSDAVIHPFYWAAFYLVGSGS